MPQPIKFLHIGDTHLGYRQYHLEERFEDFNRAFAYILNRAIREGVDFIIHSGDFFHNNNLDPETLTAIFTIINDFKHKAKQELKREIPIIAIQGNHDQRGYTSKKSWLHFMAEQQMIVLLDAQYDSSKDRMIFEPYDAQNASGGMISLGDVDIYGVPSYGSSTEEILPSIADAIPEQKGKVTILIMHTGIHGQVKNKLGVDIAKNIKSLQGKVDYLALGHYHRRYMLPIDKPWIFNPGSLEIVDAEDYFKGYARGAFIAQFKYPTTNEKDYILERPVKIIDYSYGLSESNLLIPNRNFMDIPISLTPEKAPTYEKTKEFILTTILKYGVKERQENNPTKEKISYNDLNIPILYISLKGEIPYSKSQVNTRELREEIKDRFEILELRLNTFFDSLVDGISVEMDEDIPLDKIERQAYTDLIELSPRFSPHRDEILDLVLDVQNRLYNRDKIENIAQTMKVWWKNHGPNIEIEENTKELESELPPDQSPDTQENLDDKEDEDDIGMFEPDF